MLLDSAQGIVRRKVPPTTPEEAERAVVLGVKRNIELGWTQIQDAGGSYTDVDIFKKLYEAGHDQASHLQGRMDQEPVLHGLTKAQPSAPTEIVLLSGPSKWSRMARSVRVERR